MYHATETTASVSTLKRGEYIKRKADSKTVYIRGAYDAPSKTYSLIDAEDACREIFVKGSLMVFVGFTY